MSESGESRRAQRFSIKVRLRYRVLGEADWRNGTTENISAAGIFFRCEQLAERDTDVEIDFVLRSRKNKRRGARVVCLGKIGRSELSTGNANPSALAAEIKEYRLLPWQGGTR